MKNTFKQIIYLVGLILLLVLPFFVFAANSSLSGLTYVGEKAGYEENVNQYVMSQLIGNVIQTFLSLLGVIFIVLIIYGGFKWMKASGRAEEVEKAQSIIRQAIIGLIITVGSWAITSFVLSRLLY